MNKIPNGNWEDDKEIYHQFILDGQDINETLKLVYEYGKNDGLGYTMKILNGDIRTKIKCDRINCKNNNYDYCTALEITISSEGQYEIWCNGGDNNE